MAHLPWAGPRFQMAVTVLLAKLSPTTVVSSDSGAWILREEGPLKVRGMAGNMIGV